MKKVLKSIVSVILTAAIVLQAAPLSNLAEAAELTSGMYTYVTMADKKARITGIDESASGEIQIPAMLDGYQIVAIGTAAFRGRTQITSVVIPDSVREIDDRAFQNCAALVSVDLGQVESLGVSVFGGCTSLKSLVIPNTVTGAKRGLGHINGSTSTVAQCGPLAGSGIESVIFEKGIANIPDNICANCTTLKDVVIPEKTSDEAHYRIGAYAFYNTSISNVDLPQEITYIGTSAFQDCGNLGAVTIPDSCSYVGGRAFWRSGGYLDIPAEDSEFALMLVDDEVAFTAREKGIKDSDNRYLNRDNTFYEASYSQVSSTGFVTLMIQYEFKEEMRERVSDVQLRICIPSSAELIEDTIRSNGTAIEGVYRDGILNINGINPSGTITFCVKPDNTEYLISYAQMDYKLWGKTSYTETVGFINIETRLLTLEIPHETSRSSVSVHGVAEPGQSVTLYVDGNEAGACTASEVGNYSANVELTEPRDGTIYQIDVRAENPDGTKKSVTGFITYNSETVNMTSCLMYYRGKEYDLLEIAGTSPVVYWSGGEFLFRITFENSAIIDNLYIITTRKDETRQLKAFYDETADVFVAAGFEDSLPGPIRIQYQADNKEYIVDTGEWIDWEAEYDKLSPVLKTAALRVTENRVNEQTDEGKLSATIQTTDGSDVTIDYSIEKKKVTDSSVTEKSLQQQGYTKVRTNEGTYSYVKIEHSKEAGILSFDEWTLNEWSQFTYNTTQDIVTGPLGLSEFAGVCGLAVDAVELLGKEYSVRKLQEEIQALDITQAEKQERLTALSEVNDKAVSIKLLKMLSSEVMMFAGLLTAGATGPVGWAISAALLGTGVLNNIAWTNLENNMDTFVTDFTTNILNVQFRFAIDPSGYVYEAVPGNRLEGVTATAYYKTSAEDTPILWDASEYEQSNPLTTDSEGCYAWDVPEGLWQVTFEKEGYETTYSEWLPVPPPQLEVNIGMQSLSAPEVAYVNVYKDGIEISFSQYMDINSIHSSNIIFREKGRTLSGQWTPINAEASYDGTTKYASVFRFIPVQAISGPVEAEIKTAVNYCGTNMTKPYRQTHEVTLRIDSLHVPEKETADYKTDKTIVLQAYPANAASGKSVQVTLSNTYIAQVRNRNLTFDKEGQAVLELTTLLPGDVEITFHIPNTTISAAATLRVNVNETPVAEHKAALHIQEPAATKVRYGDTITLHTEIEGRLPAGAVITWEANNDNFDLSISADGTTCTITPRTSGDTEITAVITDADGNVISSDMQEMTSKAGIFWRIIAFFKKLFTIASTFVTKNVDLIMANATAALQVAQNATLDIPILGTSITEYGEALELENFSGIVGGNVSGTSDLTPLDQQAQMIIDLIPSAKKVTMLYCSAEVLRYNR